MRVVIIDLLCNSPFYCGPLTNVLRTAGVEAELASPRFYLEPEYMDGYARASWLSDIVVHASHPRPLRLGARAIELARNWATLRHQLRHSRYDVAHVQWLPLIERQTVLMRGLRDACSKSITPLVLTMHNVLPHDMPSADRGHIRRNVDMADQIIVHTENVRAGLRDIVGATKPIAVIPHGPLFVDKQLPDRHVVRERLGLGERPVVLFQGIVSPYKGVDLLQEAWPSILRDFPSAVLLVVGRVAGDMAREQVEAIAKLPAVRVVDRFVSTELMLEYYAASDLVVFPYRAISQSGALMTAVGLGRPAVVTPLPGFLEQVAGLQSPVVAREVDGAAIAQAVCDGLDRHQTLTVLAQRDRDSLTSSPRGWKAVAARTLGVYENLSAAAKVD